MEDKPDVNIDAEKVTIDTQDPLPENNFFWRRVFSWALTLLCLALVAYALESLHGLGAAEYVFYLGKYLIGLVTLLVTYYMIAPSAEQIVKMIQAAKIIRGGTALPGNHGLPPPPRQGSGGRRPDEDFAPRSGQRPPR